MRSSSVLFVAALLAGLAAACGEPSSADTCGDGVVQAGEACDDGNQTPGDGCENDCAVTAAPVCGNGAKETGEACDDGNQTPGDGCENDCTLSPDTDSDGVPDLSDNCPQDANSPQQDLDEDGLGDACDPCPQAQGTCPYSIYELRQWAVATGEAVRLQGVAVTAVAATGYFVQVPPDDPSYAGAADSGLFIYSGTGPRPAVGDRVDVEGKFENYFERLELVDSSFSLLSAGGAAIAPEVVPPGDLCTGGARAAAFQGVLVKVENVVVTDSNPDASYGGDYNEFAVTGGLRVDDLIYRVAPRPAVGQGFASITGVLDLTNANYKLEPRSAADVVASARR